MLQIKFTDVGLPPFAQKQKLSGGSALVNIADGLLGGMFSLIASDRAASVQANSNYETNEMNYKIAKENNQFNEKQIDKMNAYNSASAQRARLEQAGLNPNLMMDGGSAGTQTSAPTADETGKAVPDTSGQILAQGYNQAASNIFQAGQQIAQQLYQERLMNAQTEQASANADKARNESDGVAIDNITRQASNVLRLEQMKQDVKHTTELWRNLNITNQIAKASMSDMIKRYSLQNANISSQTALNESQKALVDVNANIQREHLKWLPQEKAAGLAQTLAETQLIIANKHLSEAEAVNAYASAAESYCRQQGIKVDNEVKADTKEFAKNLVKNQAVLTDQNAQKTKVERESIESGQGPILNQVRGLGNFFNQFFGQPQLDQNWRLNKK